MEFQKETTHEPPNLITVKQLVYRLRDAVSIAVGTQWVVGELSNVKHHTSGHVYFTLKEQGAEIFCAFFKSAVARCAIQLKEGMKVHVLGDATVYPDRGQLQMVIRQVKDAGKGDLQARFLALKEKLRQEGLFDTVHKKTIPPFPVAIGIVTSPTGAVIQDIRHVLERRAPWVKAYLLPVRVQGTGAEQEIAKAIRAWSRAPLNGLPVIDVLIVGRGGGSIEDLWNFNEEIVARAIYDCSVPVISAVGHDTDFTIADFVADLRAPTPTAAAELATPDGKELLRKLTRMEQSLHTSARHSLLSSKLKLDIYLRGKLLDPDALLSPYSQRLDDLEENLLNIFKSKLIQKDQQINGLEHKLQINHPKHKNKERKQLLLSLQEKLAFAASLRLTKYSSHLSLLQTNINAHSPEQILQRGYALVENQEKQFIRQTKQIHEGEKLKIRVSDGYFYVRNDTSQ